MISPERGWAAKFRDAIRGIVTATRTESCFLIHGTVAILVVVAAAFLRVTPAEWCLLLLCIGTVISAELFNSAIESLARAITSETDPHVGRCLDIAAGGVLLISGVAAIVGLIILVPRLITALTAGGTL